MEHKHMLSVVGSSEAQLAPGLRKVDRFSGLPNNVAHHILSFLNFRTLTQLGAVSKRCRKLYLSVPSFKISVCGGNKKDQLGMLNCIDRFFILRGGSKMQSVCITWSFCSGISDEIFRLLTWIHIAARCDVEEFEFHVISWQSPEPIELPACLFRCGSLRSLVINFRGILEVPTYASFISLQSLELKLVRVDERFCQWLSSSSCKCIKELRLDEVKADNVTIKSSSLESFSYVVNGHSDLCNLSISGEKLVHIHIEWGFYKTSSRSLNISAPNLRTLKWFGRLLSRQDLGELLCLEKAEILLEHKENYRFDNVSEVLGSISRTKDLILLEETMKALFGGSLTPSPLNDVSFLSMHIGSLNDDLVPAMVFLLSGMANLNSLHICTYPSYLVDKPKACGFNKQYWESQNLAFIRQLKEVTIELSHGRNSVEFVFYILEHAKNLEKMAIFCLPHHSNLQKRIDKCKMASGPTIILRKKVAEVKCRIDMCRYLTALRNQRR